MIITSLSEYQDVTAEPSWGPYQPPTDFTRFYFVQGGEAYYRDDDGFFPLQKNHLYLLPVGKEYQLSHNPKSPIQHLFCHITTTPKIQKALDIPIEPNSFSWDAIMVLKKHIKSSDFHSILKNVDLILSTLPPSLFSALDENDYSYKIKTYIDENLECEISLDSIAEHFNFSKMHLIRLFKSAYKNTPIQYLNQKRLETSILLLKEGLSIEQISEKYHYSSPSNFSVFFKKKYGLSPKNYIKLLEDSKMHTKIFL